MKTWVRAGPRHRWPSKLQASDPKRRIVRMTKDGSVQMTKDGSKRVRTRPPRPPPTSRTWSGAGVDGARAHPVRTAPHHQTPTPKRDRMRRYAANAHGSVLHTCRTIPMPTPRLAPETATSLGAISLPFHEMPTHTGASCATTSATSSDRLIILRASPDSGRRNYRIDGWNHWRYYQIRNLLV